MKKQTPCLPSFKWSLSLMLAATLAITGLMACSTTEKSSVTQTESEDTQIQLEQAQDDQKPLYVLNGQIVDKENILNRLKPKYIESIQVWKNDEVPTKYGQKGKDGVVEIRLTDRKKALADLYTYKEMIAMKKQEQKDQQSDDDKIFMAVDDEPKLIGGLSEVQKNVKYPKSCSQAGIEGRVTLHFIVNKEGNTEDVEILRGIGGGCDEAAIKAVEKYAKFKPGKQHGKAVKVRYSLPLMFKLANSNKNDSTKQSMMNSEVRNSDESGILLDQLTVTAYG